MLALARCECQSKRAADRAEERSPPGSPSSTPDTYAPDPAAGGNLDTMDREELLKALQALDQELDGTYDVVIVGGAAMILHFGSDRATRDVDAFILSGHVSEIRHAVERVAREQDLPADWLNDGAKGYCFVLEPGLSAA